MPISFAPANPLGSSRVPYEYGKQQVERQDAARQQDAYQASIRAGIQYAQLQQQEQALNQRAAQFDVNEQNQANSQTAAMQNQANYQGAQVQGAMAMDDHRTQNNMREMQQRFTQADQLRLQKIQAGRSSIMNDPSLTDEERQQILPYIDAETNGLEVRRQQEQMRLTRQREDLVANQSAAAAARARADEAHLARGGPERFQETDPDTGETRTYFRTGGRNSEWTLAPPGGGGAGGTRSRGAGGGQVDPARLVADIESEMHREANPTAGGTAPAWASDDAAYQQEAMRRFERRQQLIEQASQRVSGNRELQPGGPVAGWNPAAQERVSPQLQGPPAPGQGQPRLAPVVSTATLAPTIQQSIIAAERMGDPAMSRDFRAINAAIRGGSNTGQLGQTQQRRLEQIGYYGGDFTPAIDRELAEASVRYEQVPITPATTSGRMSEALGERQGVSELRRLPPDPRLERMRGWLSQYKSRSNMPEDVRRQFDQFRGSLATQGVLRNWEVWPPPNFTDPEHPQYVPDDQRSDRPSVRPVVSGDAQSVGGDDYGAAPGV